MSKWQWLWRQFSKKLWVRTSLFCILAVLTSLAAIVLKDYIPQDISRKVGADSVDKILQIIATSMLAVTTFSLSTMVAAYSAATTNVTPRSTQLLLNDNTAQNALSVFLGSFLYSIVGIIALAMGVYGDSGRLILFAVTIIVIFIIVAVLIRWINYLTFLGRVGQTTDMIEREAQKALSTHISTPGLGAHVITDYTPEPDHFAINCKRIGYVQHIDMGRLSELAKDKKALIYLTMLPGAFNDSSKALAFSSKPFGQEAINSAINAFSIGDDRSFDQDPRFGLIVLSEIASRALSPAINDPGTAIDIIGTSIRLLAPWVMRPNESPDVIYPDLYVPALKTSDLFDDIYAPIARDGAGLVEVGSRLQKALTALHEIGNAEAKRQSRRHSQQALKHANLALGLQEDKDLMAHLALS